MAQAIQNRINELIITLNKKKTYLNKKFPLVGSLKDEVNRLALKQFDKMEKKIAQLQKDLEEITKLDSICDQLISDFNTVNATISDMRQVGFDDEVIEPVVQKAKQIHLELQTNVGKSRELTAKQVQMVEEVNSLEKSNLAVMTTLYKDMSEVVEKDQLMAFHPEFGAAFEKLKIALKDIRK